MTRIEEAQIRARIQQARNAAGYKQDAFADVINVGKRSMQNYEATDGAAAAKVPWHKLNDIAEVTDTSLKWILFGEDDEATKIQDRLARIEQQQTEITETLKRLLPDDSEPMTRERAAVMLTEAKRLQRQIEKWSERMERDQIGKRELDRPGRRAARAKDHPEPPEEAVG